MLTYWVFDTGARTEIVDLELRVLGMKPPILGSADFMRNYTGPRFIILGLQPAEVELRDLTSGAQHGWHGPYSSREEADLVAQRMNGNSQLPKYQMDVLAYTGAQLTLGSLRYHSREIQTLGGVGVEKAALDSMSKTIRKALRRAKSQWQRHIENE